MTTELPSINSTTSISDNADLRNYYENLLFKNGSGKSLADLPQKARRDGNQQQQGRSGAPVDFINGFSNVHTSPLQNFQTAPSMTPCNSEPIPPPSSGPIPRELYQQPLQQAQQPQQDRRQSMFYSSNDPLGTMGGFTLNFDKNGSTGSNYTGVAKQSVSPGTMASSLNADPFFEGPVFQQHREPLEERRQQYLAARRSSYISDTLIHGHLASFMGGPHVSQLPRPAANIFPSSMEAENTYNIGSFTSDASSSVAGPAPGAMVAAPPAPPSQARPLTTAPATMYGGILPQSTTQQPPRRNTQPVESATASIANPPFNVPPASFGTRSRYFSYSKQQQHQQHQHQQQQQQQQQQHHQQRETQQQQHHQRQQQQQQQPPQLPSSLKGNTAGQVPLDNGLVLLNGQKIASSADLQTLYSDCGSKYFSSQPVYEFTDYIKSMLVPTAQNIQDARTQSISNFLAFLKSCNLNYNPQSDAFVSGEKQSSSDKNSRDGNEDGNSTMPLERRPSMASTYLHYKPLVLVSLKNGKLELLSTPQNTNIMMRRGDLVIIDGDRGKDLALVVEPVVDLDLALFINFLKKKIHFDSLITSRSQHHPNNKFIQSLIQSTKGQSEELNSKLYDVIELTQLIVPSKQVLRFATPWEITTNLHNKFQDELKALHIAQLKLKSLNSGFGHHHHGHGHSHNNEGMGSHEISNSNNSNINHNSNVNGHSTTRPQLNIKILNAEFQFDRKKLTFYYFCEERNDFRELIKELFKFYKTRIWLCAIPNNLGIDQKYYDSQRKELKMYQEMMQHYAVEDLADANAQQGAGFIVAPPLNKLELDNFQIGVYKELVNELFGR
ncbi:PSP1 (YDR505C) and YLR177W [Zygosaccharomyces parabailii]|nr:PSP1 (YDR505C) and YLR177W [Zygosaccharomyces parabailii]